MSSNVVDNAARGYADPQWASDNVHRTVAKGMKFCIGKCKRAYYGDYQFDTCLACGGKVEAEEIEGLDD